MPIIFPVWKNQQHQELCCQRVQMFHPQLFHENPLELPSELSTIMPSHFHSGELTVPQSTSSSIMLSFNPNKGPPLVPSKYHSHVTSELHSSLHSLVPSMVYSLWKNQQHPILNCQISQVLHHQTPQLENHQISYHSCLPVCYQKLSQ